MTASDAPLPPAEFRVLLALADGPRHGHGVRVEIRTRTGGRVDMGPGTLYGAIKRLRERGWIVEVEGPEPEGVRDERRRYWAITAPGREAAASEADRMAELISIARAKRLRTGDA